MLRACLVVVICPCVAISKTCCDNYYKISDFASGLASSCSAVMQGVDPVVGVSVDGCWAACDGLSGCNTVNYRVVDPNFQGNSTCYRKKCGSFKEAACTLFTKHKGRDVYSKACGASVLWPKYLKAGIDGLFAGVGCPTDAESSNACQAGASTYFHSTCAHRYFQISNEASGLASSCAAVFSKGDPVVGMTVVGCYAACDSLADCNTVNYRVSDPEFDGNSTCYRNKCDTFEEATCGQINEGKGRDIYTKVCGASFLWSGHVVSDASGLFAGTACSKDTSKSGSTNAGAPICKSWGSTNRNLPECETCWSWDDNAPTPDPACKLYEKIPLSSTINATRCAQMSESNAERQQRLVTNQRLSSRWTQVGVCNMNYKPGTTNCEIANPQGGHCLARDQPCHGGLSGVAGKLSPGWEMSLDTELNHQCTQCTRGRYGHCDNACSWESNFFWSGYFSGMLSIPHDGQELLELYEAYVTVQSETLGVTTDVLNSLRSKHPLREKVSSSLSFYNIISVRDVMVSNRTDIRMIAKSIGIGTVDVVVSPSGVKVYEVCECGMCPVGKFTDGQGMTQCIDCGMILPGANTTYMGASGPDECQCLASDDMFLVENQSACVECNLVRKGILRALQWQCPCSNHDTYEDSVGDSNGTLLVTCFACPVHSTTFDAATRTHTPPSKRIGVASCLCESGFSRFATETCATCAEGLDCDWGARQTTDDKQSPRLEKGYWSSKAEPLKIYMCKSPAVCPGGAFGVCAPNREGISCGRCKDSYFEAGDTCEVCRGSNGLLLGVVVISYLALGFFIFKVGTKSKKKREAVLGSVTIAVTILYLQSTGLYSRLRLDWPSPFKEMSDSCKLFIFDMSMLRPSCLFVDPLTSKYALSLIMPLVLVLGVILWLVSSKLLHRLTFSRFPIFSLDDSINALGRILQTLYISIVSIVVDIWNCRSNPNPDLTLASLPSVVCYKGDHWRLVGVGVIAIFCYVISMPAFCTWTVYNAPARILDPNFAARYKFLFDKFCPGTYWYSLVLTVRAMALAMVIVLSSDGFNQYLLMVFILCCSLCSILIHLPYNDRYANRLEAFVLSCLLFVLAIGSWFIIKTAEGGSDGEEEDKAKQLSFLIVSSVVACLVVVLLVALYSLVIGMRPEQAEQILKREVQAIDRALKDSCAAVAGLSDGEVTELLKDISYVDRWHALQFANLIGTDVLDMQEGSRTSGSRRLPIHAIHSRRWRVSMTPMMTNSTSKLGSFTLEDSRESSSQLHSSTLRSFTLEDPKEPSSQLHIVDL